MAKYRTNCIHFEDVFFNLTDPFIFRDGTGHFWRGLPVTGCKARVRGPSLHVRMVSDDKLSGNLEYSFCWDLSHVGATTELSGEILPMYPFSHREMYSSSHRDHFSMESISADSCALRLWVWTTLTRHSPWLIFMYDWTHSGKQTYLILLTLTCIPDGLPQSNWLDDMMWMEIFLFHPDMQMQHSCGCQSILSLYSQSRSLWRTAWVCPVLPVLLYYICCE